MRLGLTGLMLVVGLGGVACDAPSDSDEASTGAGGNLLRAGDEPEAPVNDVGDGGADGAGGANLFSPNPMGQLEFGVGDPEGDAGVLSGPPPECTLETVVVNGVEIFAYEASRPDGAPGTEGEVEDRVCSRAGALPWTNVTVNDAEAACALADFRLCTNEEWEAACQGSDSWAFPYGRTHRPGLCNDHISGGDALRPAGSESGCRTPTGIYDLSGNAWEITSGPSRRGASYRVYASSFRVQAAGCTMKYVLFDDYFENDLSFRCCRTAP